MSPRVGIIGFGAIAQDLVAVLVAHEPAAQIGVLARPGREDAARATLSAVGLPPQSLITGAVAEFLTWSPDVVAECASHRAVDEYGATVMHGGADLVVSSVGALADSDLYERLKAAAGAGSVQLVVPSGAIGGLDILSAARLSGLTAVSYVGRKPPAAWAGTPAEEAQDLGALTAPTVIFEGSAREAATSYPKNANVAATLALAGMGMDATRVTLIADPTKPENIHEYTISSPAVEATISIVGKPSPRNPKTSQTTALSIARAVMNRSSAIVI